MATRATRSFGIGALAARAALGWIRRDPQAAQLERTNFHGRTVTLAGGPALAAGATVGAVAGRPRPGRRGRRVHRRGRVRRGRVLRRHRRQPARAESRQGFRRAPRRAARRPGHQRTGQDRRGGCRRARRRCPARRRPAGARAPRPAHRGTGPAHRRRAARRGRHRRHREPGQPARPAARAGAQGRCAARCAAGRRAARRDWPPARSARARRCCPPTWTRRSCSATRAPTRSARCSGWRWPPVPGRSGGPPRWRCWSRSPPPARRSASPRSSRTPVACANSTHWAAGRPAVTTTPHRRCPARRASRRQDRRRRPACSIAGRSTVLGPDRRRSAGPCVFSQTVGDHRTR